MIINLTDKSADVNKRNNLSCGITSILIKEIEQLVQSEFTKTQVKLANSLFYFCAKYKDVYISQSRLSQITGCARETANRLLDKLHNSGLIKRINRGVKKTCLYVLPQFLSDFFVRKKLSKIFNSLNLLPIFWLTQEPKELVVNQVFKENVTQYSRSIFIDKQQQHTSNVFNIQFVSSAEKTTNNLEVKELNTTIQDNISTYSYGLAKGSRVKHDNVMDNIANFLMLDDFERTKFDVYEPELLQQAEKIYAKNLTGGVVPSNKKAYFLGICSKLLKEVQTKAYSSSGTEASVKPQKGKVAEPVKPFAGHGGQSEDEIAASWRRPDIQEVYEKGMANLKNCPQHIKDEFKQTFQYNFLKYNSQSAPQASTSSPDGKEMTLLERRNARLAEYKANGNAHNRYNPNK